MPVLTNLGDFRLESELSKLKSSVPRFGSAWNKRYFRVEERMFPTGEPVLVLAYYENMSKVGVSPPKGTLLLRDIEHINELWRDGRMYISRGSVMTDRRVAAATKVAQQCFEVDGATRHFILCADSVEDMQRWVSALQFICDKQQTLPWNQKWGRLPRAMIGTRSMARIDAKTMDNFDVPRTPKQRTKLPVDLDYGLPAPVPEQKKSKPTPFDVQASLEAAITARMQSRGGKEEDDDDYGGLPTFDEGVSESDDEDADRRPQKVFSRDLDEDDEMDDRAGVSRQGKGGRMVGAHLSTVNLYASPRSTRSTDTRSPHRGAGGPGAGPSSLQDAPIMSSPPKNRRRHAAAESGKANEGSDDGEGKFDTASGGGGKASDNEEDDDDDEDLEVARARMRAALKKKKKKKKKGKKAKPHRAEAKFDSGDEVEATPAPAPAVAADEDFVEANWDDDEDEHGAAAAAEARARAEEEARRKALRDPGVRPDEDFADANWDDDEGEGEASGAAPQSTRQRMDPGVAVDEDFVDADWDEEDE